MKTPSFIFATIGCALLMPGVNYAGPSGNGAAVPKEPVPDRPHPAPSEQARPSLKTVRNLGLGKAIIGGPATPTKAAPAITGMVNPAKNTAAVSGTGMKRKP